MKDVERRFLSSNPDVKVDGVYGPQMAGLMAFYGAC